MGEKVYVYGEKVYVYGEKPNSDTKNTDFMPKTPHPRWRGLEPRPSTISN